MKTDFDLLVICDSASHAGRRSFVAGFEYLPDNDTPSLRAHGAHWGVSTSRTESASVDGWHIHDDNAMRLRLACRKCPRPVVALRLRVLAPILDTLAEQGIRELSLTALAAILDGSRRRTTG